MIIKGYLFSILYGIVCLGISLVLYKLGLDKKYTRKAVHILVGFEWVILYHYFGASVHFLAVALIFTALLALLYFTRLTPMISSDSDNAPGTVYYGVAMSIMAALSLFIDGLVIPFGIGVFATSFGDGFAGLFGQIVKKHNPEIYRGKTIVGFLSNLIISFLIPLVFNAIFDMGISVWQCVLVAVLSASLEMISAWGLDNIVVTLGVSFFVYMMINFDAYLAYIIPIMLTPFIIAFVIQKKALTTAGTLAAVILDIAVTISLGNYGFILLLTFLVGSVLIDKIKERKNKDDGITKKGDCRDITQVIANGLVPMISVLLFAITKNEILIAAYVASLAEAFADTAASGFGVFSNSTFDILKLKRCEKGISGGVSLIGTLAAFAVSFVIPALAYAFGIIELAYFIVCTLAAFVGVFLDSVLGSLVQVKYQCGGCGKITEREIHCEEKTRKVSGISFVDNDAVNLISGLLAALFACLLLLTL